MVQPAPLIAVSSEPQIRPGSGAMFDRIAQRYDLLNRILSLGVDQRWRLRAIDALALQDGERVLDLATGTGDVALALAQRYPRVQIEALDPSGAMLDIARRKAQRLACHQRIAFQAGEAESLPFSDRHFDAAIIAFGIRNVVGRTRALAELRRVVRPEGRIAILELTDPRIGWLSPAARWWIHRAVPWVGATLSGAAEYRYLEKSIAAFPAPSQFERELQAAGLQHLQTISLLVGVATIFVAQPEPS